MTVKKQRSKEDLKLAQIEAISERAATKALEGFFLAVGIDASTPEGVLATQKDFAHLRSFRESVEQVKRRGLLTAVTIVVTGALGLLYAGLSHH